MDTNCALMSGQIGKKCNKYAEPSLTLLQEQGWEMNMEINHDLQKYIKNSLE